MTLNDVIGSLGKGGKLRFDNVNELGAMPHFDKFVHHAAAHYRWVQPEHMGDLLALVANAFQAGINVGYEFHAHEVQEKVDRAVLEESEWWYTARHSVYTRGGDHHMEQRLAANRAKVGGGK